MAVIAALQARDNFQPSERLTKGADVTKSKVTVVTFNMPAASKEAFEQEWLLDAPFMARQTGLLEGALCVRILESDQVQFVNVAKWDSQSSLDAARKAVSYSPIPGQISG